MEGEILKDFIRSYTSEGLHAVDKTACEALGKATLNRKLGVAVIGLFILYGGFIFQRVESKTQSRITIDECLKIKAVD